jgi:hypothetical protein
LLFIAGRIKTRRIRTSLTFVKNALALLAESSQAVRFAQANTIKTSMRNFSAQGGTQRFHFALIYSLKPTT